MKQGGKKAASVVRVGLVLAVVGAAYSLPISWSELNAPQSFAQQQAIATSQAALEVRTSWEDLNTQVNQLLERTHKLVQIVTSAPDKRGVLARVSSELGELADAFERIAQRKNEIEATLLERVEALRRLPTNVEAKIAELQQQRSKLLGRIETLKATPSPENEIRIKSTTSILNDLDAQIKVLSSFRNAQVKIGDATKSTVAQIQKLLVAIEENATVFRSKKATVDMTGDILAALGIMESVPEFERLTQSITASWDQLNSLIKELADWASQILSK